MPSAPVHSKQNPFAAEVVVRQPITGRGSSKSVWHIELDLEDSGLSYQPGDSIGILPRNPEPLVEALLQATRLSGDATISSDSVPVSLREALLAGKEITALSRPTLEAVAEQHAELGAIIADRDRFSHYLATRQLIDLVHEFPLQWQPQQFVDVLRKLAPRSYSIANTLT